ncbi:ABC transporter substrate-binding protein [Catellatospora sichuanensis]|uniref:ABC transporter substrate-binding protein n=1 Tax=Catellatospora sichuanensis TaxID=1969805 RepID=UPI001C9102E5|nr:ABC transporter substrate-binding protein [Catellatospora sichuanensis]
MTGVPLRVGSAFPNPPFEVAGPPPTGFDIDWMTAIAAELGRPLVARRYDGSNFDGIFAELGRSIDVVASGATVTEYRKTLARWCEPYLRSGQSLVVDAAATPGVHGCDDLRGLTLGVQSGNTSQPVAEQLLAAGKVGAVKAYAYEEIGTALDDLEHGRLGAFMKLEPVLRRLIADRPALRIVQTGITTELLAVAVATDDAALADEIDGAQQALRRDGELARLGRRWLADSDPRATAVLT